MNNYKRYLIDMGPLTVFYIASVVAAGVLSTRMRILVAMIPLPSVAWMADAEMRRQHRGGELRQHIEVDAMTIAFSISFCVIVMLTFPDLFGALKKTVPVAGLIVSAGWLGAQIWMRLRYRYWA